MKGLLCALCTDFRALAPEGPVYCRCGNVEGRWVDSARGIAQFRAHNRAAAYGIGMHNTFLREAVNLGGRGMPEDWRALHERITDSPGYMFDKSRRACWVIVFKPGTTTDTSWADDGAP